MATDDTGLEPHRGLTPGTPAWVKAFAIIAIVVVLLFVILHLSGGGAGGHRLMDHGA
jgi:enoyl reductase-like protein